MIGGRIRNKLTWMAAGLLLSATSIFSPAVGQQTVLPAITVTAPSPIVPNAARGPFAPVTILDQADIDRLAAASIGDLLSTQPGITASTFAPGASRPIIRGLDNFRVRVQENGIGTLDVSEIGEDHAVPLDPLAIERVEVVRGPATLRYGSHAIGGVVSATNNRIPDLLTAWGVHGYLKGGLSTADQGRDGIAVVEARGEHGAFHADIFARRADDYRIPGGVQPNTRLHGEGGSVGGSYLFHGGYMGAAITHNSGVYHIPGTESAEGNTRIDLRQTKLLAKGEYQPDAHWLDAARFWLGATRYRHHERGLDEFGDDVIHATFKNREQEARLEFQLTPVATGFGALATAVGVQAGNQQLGTEGEAGSLLAPSKTRNAAAYLFNELQLDRNLRLQAAGRIETVHVEGTAADFPADLMGSSGSPVEYGSSRSFTPAGASFGILRDLPGDVVASFAAQYVERAPRAAELFAKGPHDASGTFEIGNNRLVKEAAQAFEIGLRRQAGPWRFDIAAYHMRYQNFIYKQLTGMTCDDDFGSCGTGGSELMQVVYTQRDARFTGAELSGALDVTPLGTGMLGLDAQYDIVRARFADGGNVPRIPPQRLGGGVFWRDQAWFARVGLLHAFAQKRLAENETPTGGYDLVKFELSHTHTLADNAFGLRALTLGVVGTNLLDDEVRNHVSFRKDEVLQPGRSIRFFANAAF